MKCLKWDPKKHRYLKGNKIREERFSGVMKIKQEAAPTQEDCRTATGVVLNQLLAVSRTKRVGQENLLFQDQNIKLI